MTLNDTKMYTQKVPKMTPNDTKMTLKGTIFHPILTLSLPPSTLFYPSIPSSSHLWRLRPIRRLQCQRLIPPPPNNPVRLPILVLYGAFDDTEVTANVRVGLEDEVDVVACGVVGDAAGAKLR